MSGPHRNTTRVEQVADVVGVDRLPVGGGECERDGAATIDGLVWSENREAGQSLASPCSAYAVMSRS